LKAIAAAEPGDDGRPLLENARFREKIARIEIDLMALEITNLRMIAALRGGAAPGAEASLLKIKGSDIQQRLTELMMQAVGPYAQPYQPEAFDDGWNGEPIGPPYAWSLAPTYFNYRKVSIYGGSNEIQKNIVAKATLGL
jgi:alkylation response protein AidB-like acyl-CoA dehydrogenase